MTLGGPELKEWRERAGWAGRDGRVRFAAEVGVGVRTVEGWESASGHVPAGKEQIVRRALETGSTLAAVSDLDLIAALTARLARYAEIERERDRLLTLLAEHGVPIAGILDERVADMGTGHEQSGQESGGAPRNPGPRIRGRGPRRTQP